ncbi:MAG: T9SS type A sorting domain-containing protein, partial [Candidatus Cloacimonetes bacterium]|nr:T9SS type A sorting domain-containing protein [Candidatus Cloacimonadota bacterium]
IPIIYDTDFVDVSDDVISANHTNLYQNYPNPFNPATTFYFSIPEETNVDLSIYNIKGQHVKTLVNDIKPAGEHSIIWDRSDNNKIPVSSGVYFYKLNVNSKTEAVKKCLLLK